MLELLLATKKSGPTITGAYALFAGGTDISGTTKATDYYLYASDTLASGGELLNVAQNDHSAAGNYTVGIFAPAGASSQGNRYTFASSTFTPFTEGSIGRSAQGATSTNTAGYFAGGNGFTSGIYSYNFSTFVAALAANLGTARQQCIGIGEITYGYFTGGYISTPANTQTVEKLTYSNNSIAFSTALGSARRRHAGAGNTTIGVVAGGLNTSGLQISLVDKITFATGARVSGTVLSTARYTHSGTGTGTMGYFGGGSNGSVRIATVEKYQYSDDVRTDGTSLTTPRYYPNAVSSTPGGF